MSDQPAHSETTGSESRGAESHGAEPRGAATMLILLFVLMIRFVNLLLLQRSPAFPFKIGDAARYDSWGADIAAGNWLGEGVFYQAPLYPYFLGTIYSLFGNDIMTVRKVQAVIGAVSCVLLMNAIWNLFNRRAAIVAGLVMACYVPSIFLETLLQKSVLDLFFICLIIWLVSRIKIQTNLRNWLAVGAAIGGLCLTRENALALIPFFVLWSLTIAATTWPTRCQRTALLLSGLAIILGPVAIRNYVVGGEFHLTTSQLGPNFYIGNNPHASGRYEPLLPGRGNAKYEQADAVAIASEAEGRQLSASEVSDYFMGQSKQYIAEQPWDWMRLLGHKTLLSINATEIVDTEDQYTAATWSPIMQIGGLIFNFGLLAPLAVIGIWRLRKRAGELWILLAMTAIFQLTMIAFFVFGRYRFPIVPLLIVFASPLIADLILRAREILNKPYTARLAALTAELRMHWKPLVCGFLVLVACHIPLISHDAARAVTYNNFGAQMLLRGKFDEARNYLDESLEIEPDNVLALNNMGVAWREQNQPQLAREYFSRALELEPDLETARRNLSKLIMQQDTLQPSQDND